MSDGKVILEAEMSQEFYDLIQRTMGLSGIDDMGEFMRKAVGLYKIAAEAVRCRGRIAIIDDEGEVVQEITGILANPIDSESESA